MITTIVLNPAVDKVYFVNNFEAGGMYRIKDTLISAGGKGINVARVARILGDNTVALGFKGGGTGEWLENQIKKIGVVTNFIEVDGESRTNNNIIDRTRGTETEVLEVGPVISSKDLSEFIKLYEKILIDTDIVICSGGIPQGVPEDIYRNLIERAKPFNVKVLLDASGDVLREGIKAKPFMVKPNLRELSQFAGRELNEVGDIIKVCRDINAQGIKVVIASLGENGAIMVTGDGCFRAIVPHINAVNTVGSGDSFVAGFASGIDRGYSEEDAFILGTACGVNNAQHEGIGVIEKKCVDKLKKHIIVENVI